MYANLIFMLQTTHSFTCSAITMLQKNEITCCTVELEEREVEEEIVKKKKKKYRVTKKGSMFL